MTRRILAGGFAAVTTVLLAASATFAGGWATVEPDQGATPPTEDETTDFGFTVLQHGETPAGWEQATVVFQELSSGQTIDVVARPSGADGHFVASVTLPAAGFWTWRVELRDLIVESPPSLLGVLTVDGAAPAFDSTTVTALVERSTQSLRHELGSDYGARINSLGSQVDGLTSQLARAATERDALAAQVQSLQQATLGVPVLGLLAVSILGGALAGFTMAVLARRPQGPAGVPADSPISAKPLVAR
jgi:hypothetical protein